MTEFKNGDKVWFDGCVCLYVGKHPAFDTVVLFALESKQLLHVLAHRLYPYREPVKVSGWVNVYKGLASRLNYSFHATRDCADSGAYIDRIACIYVSGTEGVEP